jgi:hypothetical protein
MRALALVALLLAPALAGCSDLLERPPAGCGEERRHRLVHDDFTPATHAVKRTQGTEVVYLWEIAVTGACEKEHAAIDLHAVVADDPSGCRGPSSVVGAAYLPGSFVSAHTIPMSTGGDVLTRTYTGSASYGLRQGAVAGRTTYTVDIEVHYEADGHDSDCGENTIRSVEIVVVDRVAK